MELSKGGCENVSLTWRQIARRIDELIAADRFMADVELAMYDTHTAAYASYNRAKPYHDNDIVLVQYGGVFYTYGTDARLPRTRSGSTPVRPVVWIMLRFWKTDRAGAGCPARVQTRYPCLRERTELTVDFHLPNELREQYEQRLYEALMASDHYADAVMNSDEENATLTGERVLREYVADSDDRDFQRAYYDNPRHARRA